MRDSIRLPLAFLASGAAALLFEVLWFRALGRVLGNTVWAGALVLTAFMLGMALGGVLAARWAQRIRNPARAFAAAELTVAVTGTLLVWGLPELEALAGHALEPLVEHGGLLAASRLAFSLAALLVPTTAMGMTLAFGVRALSDRDTTRALGILYAANTLGACMAPLLAEYHLIGGLGLRGTALCAAAMNLTAAAIAWRYPRPAPPLESRPEAPLPVRFLAAAALAGALALGLEVIGFRLLLLYVPGNDTSFSLMLSIMLFGIAAGGALAPLLARAGLAWVAAGGGVAVIAGYFVVGPFYIPGRPEVVHYALALMAPAALLSGALFTLLGSRLRVGASDPQAAIGRLTTANALGAAAGAALAGLVLLPSLGIEKGLFVLAAGYALLCVLLVERGAPRRGVWPALIAFGALAVFPFGRMQAHLDEVASAYQSDEQTRVVQVTEGPNLTLQVLAQERFGEFTGWRLLTDSYSMAGINRYSLRYMRLFAWLPLSLHHEPRRALLISYGAGNTAQALLSDPHLARLTVVDLSPEILAASPRMHGRDDPLRDARVRVVIEDGRHFLRTRSERFDIITGEPPPPMMAGVVNLYTREYFAALAERLAPGGLASYWLPVDQFKPAGARAVIAAFCAAFADCSLWAGGASDWILLGGRDFRGRADAAHFARLWRSPAAALFLTTDGLERPEQLGATFLADAQQLRDWTAGTPPVTDDHPKRLHADVGIEEPFEEYVDLLKPEGARQRFAASSWVAARWPTEFARASGAYFALQPILNSMFAPAPGAKLREVDRVLRETDLKTPVLWLLDSNLTEQQAVARRVAADQGGRSLDPRYAYALGVGALAQRDYRGAAGFFVQAAERDPGQAGALAAYALCRARAPQRARAVNGAQQLTPELRCWKE